MSLALPSGSAGRLLALGILLVVALVIWLGAVSPLIGLYQDREETLAQRRSLAVKMHQVAALLPKLEAEADAQANSVRPARACCSKVRPTRWPGRNCRKRSKRPPPPRASCC